VKAEGGERLRASVAFVCDACDRPIYLPVERAADGAICPGCGRGHPLRIDGSTAGSGRLLRCLRCGTDRLYRQKDFNKGIGIAIFSVAALLSVPTWGLSLLAATLIDLLLYYLIGDVTLCYVCGAQHRGFTKNPAHGPFDLHVAEAIDRAPRPV